MATGVLSFRVPCDPILRTVKPSSWTRYDWRYPLPLDATVICTRQWLLGRCANHWLADKRFKLHSTKIWALQNFLRTYPVSPRQSCWESAAAASAYWLSFRRHAYYISLTTFEVHTMPSIDNQCHLCYGCWPPPLQQCCCCCLSRGST